MVCKCLVVIFSHRAKALSCSLHFISGFSLTTYLLLVPGSGGHSHIRGHPLGLHACVILLYELVKRLGGLFLETFLILRCLQ